MSDYTTQLRFICESYAGRTEEGSQATDIDDIIALARPQLFNFDYPIFDDAYKPELESKIINHFYTQEIGQETVGLFKQRLKTKMREIMPYYNQLYMSERLKFDPFKNADYIDTHNQSNKGNRTGTSDNTAGFSNVTNNDVQYKHNNKLENVHDDTTDITNAKSQQSHEYWDGNVTDNETRDKSGSITGTENTQHSGDDTLKHSGSSIDLATKGGTDMGVTIPAINKRTLVKQADTPLGQVQSTLDQSKAAAHNTGIGPGGLNGGYLSGVQETVDNYAGGSYDETNGNKTIHHPRNHDYNEMRYGEYYNLNPNDNGWYKNMGTQDEPNWQKVPEGTQDAEYCEFSERVSSDQRKDIVAHINGWKMKWVEADPTKGQKHGHWTVDKVNDDPTDKTTYGHNINSTSSGTNSESDIGYKHEDSDRTTDNTSTSAENGSDINIGHYTNTQTEGSHTDNDTIATGTSNSNTIDREDTESKLDYFGKVFGKVGSETYSEMLQKFRATFLNIDMDVIHDLEPLFMMVW